MITSATMEFQSPVYCDTLKVTYSHIIKS